MSPKTFSLDQLGWRSHYAQNLTLADFEAGYPARVTAVHRTGLSVLSSRGHGTAVLPPSLVDTESAVAVGDWVMVDHDADRVIRLIERYTLIERVAAGGDHRRQSIAANLDTLFVVTSCNDDFNPSRLERYLTLAAEAGVEPIVVLTKSDLSDHVDHYVATAQRCLATVVVLAVNATDTASVAQLSPWLEPGHTVAFVGSSGVGKSTLTNSLMGDSSQLTGGIRADDAKGRHTTTAREMFPTPFGAWVIDTPGMRELRVGAVEAGLGVVFDDIEALAMQCRFSDCRHGDDAGCAVGQAITEGVLDARRFANYQKLQREAAEAQRTVREKRELSRQFGAMGKAAMRAKRERLDR
ncbi:MAG: ribosome small subunit-dependent GTPase A [Rhodanobacter sp.]